MWEVGNPTGRAGRGVGVPGGNLIHGRFSAEVHVVRVGVKGVVVLVIGSAGAGKCAEDLCSGLGRGKLSASK